MALGAFSPTPLRLGGTDKTGLTAAAQSRMAADLAAVKRTQPFAVLTGTLASSVFTVEEYYGRNGSGLTFAPTAAFAFGAITLTWPKSYEDKYERDTSINLVHGGATVWGTTAKDAAVLMISNQVQIVITDSATGAAAEGQITLVVDSDEGAHFADYGGDPDKEDSPEGDVPYAALWYDELKAMRGSAYTGEQGTLVHAENLAIARILSAVFSRTPEKRVANSSPARADEKLPEWIQLLQISARPGDRALDIRKRLAAKTRAPRGPTFDNENAALAELLGDIFVEAHRQKGTSLAVPPPITFWPGVNPGPASHDLGGGAWISERAHLFVEVQRPVDGDLLNFNDLTRRQLFDLLDGLVPAWVTFDFATSDGFLLDLSDMDFDGMGSE